MSQENAELVKALFPQPDTDIVPMFRNDRAFAQMREALSPFLAHDFQSAIVLPAQTRTYAGLDGFRKNWLDWLEPWATYRSEIDELIDVGERVVLLLRDYGRREGMDAEVELISATIVTFREGKIVRWEDYADRAVALESVGLSAQDAHAKS
jgi:SnoaL-like domain